MSDGNSLELNLLSQLHFLLISVLWEAFTELYGNKCVENVRNCVVNSFVFSF